MDDKRKDAYLHLMYRAFVEIRLSSALYIEMRSNWWNPFKWNKYYKFIRKINRLSDAFHNLPLLLKSDNNDFDEESFWRHLDSYEKNYVFHEYESYKSVFDRVLSGE